MPNITLTLDDNLVPHSWKYLCAVLREINAGRFNPFITEESERGGKPMISLDNRVCALFFECRNTKPVKEDVFDNVRNIDDSGSVISGILSVSEKIRKECDTILQGKDYPDFFRGNISTIRKDCQMIADIFDCYQKTWPRTKDTPELWYHLFETVSKDLLDSNVEFQDEKTASITFSIFEQILENQPYIEVDSDYIENSEHPLTVGFKAGHGMAAYFFVITLMSGKVVEPMDIAFEDEKFDSNEFLDSWKKSLFDRFRWTGYRQHSSENWLDEYMDFYAGSVPVPDTPFDRRQNLSSLLNRPVFDDIVSPSSLLKNNLASYTADILPIRIDIATRSTEGVEPLRDLYRAIISETRYLLINREKMANQFSSIPDKNLPTMSVQAQNQCNDRIDALIQSEIPDGSISELLEQRNYYMSTARLAGKPEFGYDAALKIIDSCIQMNDIVTPLLKTAIEETEAISSMTSQIPTTLPEATQAESAQPEHSTSRKEWMVSQLQQKGYIDADKNIISRTRSGFAKEMVENGYARPNEGWEGILIRNGKVVDLDHMSLENLNLKIKRINWDEWDTFELKENGSILSSKALRKSFTDKISIDELIERLKLVGKKCLSKKTSANT